MTLIPFLLEGVGGHPNLMQQDGLHPNAEGTRIVAVNVMRALEPLSVAAATTKKTVRARAA